jgi:NADPH:quinone reductase-like Zn-dependent oxidoreductase
MRAVVQRGFGGTEQLSVQQLPDPTPGEGEVLVRVTAAAVDRGTWHLLTGLPYVARPYVGLRSPRFPVVGRDVSGTVAAVGAGVTGYAVGDRVLGTADGSCAELAVVPVTRLVPLPEGLDPVASAALPISGLTALQGLAKAHRGDGVRTGDRVLVIGASGGVGSYAVQLAASAGAEVTGVASAAKADLVRDLGATRVLDYAAGPLDDGTRYDLVLVAGGENGGRWTAGAHRQLLAMLWSPFVGQRLTGLVSAERAEDLQVLVEHAAAGRVRPAVDRTFSLEETPKALDHLADGHVRGKALITL